MVNRFMTVSSGHVLDHHRARLPQHVRAGHGALQAAQVAGLLPGRDQPLLRRPLHLRDAYQDVRPRSPGEVETMKYFAIVIQGVLETCLMVVNLFYL